jgi:hypothetical protein
MPLCVPFLKVAGDGARGVGAEPREGGEKLA